MLATLAASKDVIRQYGVCCHSCPRRQVPLRSSSGLLLTQGRSPASEL